IFGPEIPYLGSKFRSIKLCFAVLAKLRKYVSVAETPILPHHPRQHPHTLCHPAVMPEYARALSHDVTHHMAEQGGRMSHIAEAEIDRIARITRKVLVAGIAIKRDGDIVARHLTKIVSGDCGRISVRLVVVPDELFQYINCVFGLYTELMVIGAKSLCY